MTKNTTQRPDIESTFRGLNDVAGVLNMLWTKAAPTLSDGELAGIAGAGTQVCENLEQLAQMLIDIGCVDGAARRSSDTRSCAISDTSSVLFPMADWLRAQAALSSASAEAVAMLLQPSVYGRGQS